MDKNERLRAWRAANKDRVREHLQSDYQRHREKRLAYTQEYRKKNPEKIREIAQRARQRRTPEQVENERQNKRIAALMRRYGITAEAYDALLAQQDGHCALCLRTAQQERYGYLNVDHDHVTGAVRGLLCTPCNHAIGALGDTPEGLQKALDYLRG